MRPAIVGLAGLCLASCGDRFSTQEAYERCLAEKDRPGASITDESFRECVSCFEDCGSECTSNRAIPPRFTCPE